MGKVKTARRIKNRVLHVSKTLTVMGDSQLLINFSNKEYTPKDEHMHVHKIEKHFQGMELQHVPRGENKEADDIAQKASRREAQEQRVFRE